ncbi:MAG: hypothetical protein A2W26_10580 [Acidobacteria bacterium RBG_16_64_8]|nr:MAG: hypothetical protein A2W26_10580 [Acidobacteria bacterium RBG_16_64_8]
MRPAQILLATVASLLAAACGTLTVMPTRSVELYVTNELPGSITVYAASATGNIAPVRRISGAATLLDAPMYLALDGAGNLHVANVGVNTVSVYAAASNGDVPPMRVIHGVAPGGLGDLVVDGAGNMYVSDTENDTIRVYSPGATGNVPPSRTISGADTGLSRPVGLALDGVGTLYVLNRGFMALPSLRAYAPGANGNAAPIQTIAGICTGLQVPRNLAVDSEGKLYVTNHHNREEAITVYAAGASGNASPIRTIRRTDPATSFVSLGDVAVDLAGYVYVTEAGGVAVFSPTANGLVEPIRMIVGGATTLTNPNGVALWP